MFSKAGNVEANDTEIYIFMAEKSASAVGQTLATYFAYKSDQQFALNQDAAYSQFFSIVFGYERLLSHVHFSYCNRKGQNSRDKLPKYGNEVTQDVEQRYLDGANLLCCLHHVTKRPER